MSHSLSRRALLAGVAAAAIVAAVPLRSPRTAKARAIAALGQRLRQARLSAGKSPEQAAEALSVDPDKLAAWESGQAEPTITQGVRLCQFYSVADIDRMLSGHA